MEQQKTLHITWQRLVDDFSATCPRCCDTEKNLDAAVERLRPLLAQQGIHVALRKKRLRPLAFNRNPLASNLLSIEGKALETWLQAETGTSECCDVCGDSECRTLIYEGFSYEGVPMELIARGILKAVEAIFQVRLDLDPTDPG